MTRTMLCVLLATTAVPAFGQNMPDGEQASSPVNAESSRVDDIVVTAERAATPSLGALGDKPILDTPFSIRTYDAELLRDIQATSLTDVVRLEPGATTFLSEVNEGSDFLLRGFAVQTYYMDSVPGLGGTRSDPPLELYDGVQILKGAAGFLFGFTSPGGIVNFVSKRPYNAPFLTASAGYAQDSLVRGHIDTGFRSADGNFGSRLNIAGESGRSNYLDTGIRRLAIGLNNDIQLTPTTRIQIDGQRSRRRLIGDSYGINLSAGVAIPDPISGRQKLSADFGGFRYAIDSINGAMIQELGGGWTARLDAALTENTFSYYDSVLLLTNNDGDYQFGNFKINQLTRTKAGQLRISGSLRTGPIEHNLTLGAYGLRQERTTGRTNSGATSTGAYIPGGNLYQPFPDLVDPGFELPSLANGYRSQNLTEKALFLSDTMKVGDHWQLLVGLRYVWRDQIDLRPDATVSRLDERIKLTPTIALLYKPIDTVTAYASYAQSLQAGGTAPTNAENAGEIQPPIASKQYEAGVKAQFGKLLATAAFFRIERGFEFLLDRPAPQRPLYIQDGTQRHDGLELALSGRLNPEWQFSGGIQLLDAKIVEGLPTIVGKEPPVVPDFQAKLFAEYAPASLDGFAMSAVANYTSGSFQDAANTRSLDGFFTLGMGIRYRLATAGTPLTLRANIDNVFDEKYWLPRASLTPGGPRSLTLSVTAEF